MFVFCLWLLDQNQFNRSIQITSNSTRQLAFVSPVSFILFYFLNVGPSMSTVPGYEYESLK